MSLDDLVNEFLNDPDNDDDSKDGIRALMASHLTSAMKLQSAGLLREAIDEFSKENNRPIKSKIDAEIVQKSYWHIGIAYRKLGEVEDAKAAFQKARELWNIHGVGSGPHYDLAEILIEQNKLDEAIEVCQELLGQIPDGGMKQLLAKILALKKGKLNS